MTALVFEVGLPHRELSPNGAQAKHWGVTSAAKAEYREWVKIAALNAMRAGSTEGWPAERVRVSLAFGIEGRSRRGKAWRKSALDYAPRDVTNAVAAFKAGFDGLIDAGIAPDDSFQFFELGSVTIDPLAPAGVTVTVERLA